MRARPALDDSQVPETKNHENNSSQANTSRAPGRETSRTGSSRYINNFAVFLSSGVAHLQVRYTDIIFHSSQQSPDVWENFTGYGLRWQFSHLPNVSCESLSSNPQRSRAYLCEYFAPVSASIGKPQRLESLQLALVKRRSLRRES